MPAANATSNYLSPIELNASKVRQKDLHLLADIVELACLKSIDHETTLEEALDEQFGENEGIGGIVETEPSPVEEGADSAPAMRNDRQDTRLRDIQAHLLGRNNLFEDNYPFANDDGFIKGSRLAKKLPTRHFENEFVNVLFPMIIIGIQTPSSGNNTYAGASLGMAPTLYWQRPRNSQRH